VGGGNSVSEKETSKWVGYKRDIYRIAFVEHLSRKIYVIRIDHHFSEILMLSNKQWETRAVNALPTMSSDSISPTSHLTNTI